MPTDFRSVNIPLPDGTGTKTPQSVVSFGSAVLSADTAVKSFFFDYDSDDHHINVVEATTGVRAIQGNTVIVAANARYADRNFDDAYTGQVTVLVIAQVALPANSVQYSSRTS
jgi:hypothetical protein